MHCKPILRIGAVCPETLGRLPEAGYDPPRRRTRELLRGCAAIGSRRYPMAVFGWSHPQHAGIRVGGLPTSKGAAWQKRAIILFDRKKSAVRTSNPRVLDDRGALVF